jgi:hypothetical protein
MNSKKCSKCKVIKLNDCYYTNSARKDGLAVYCKECLIIIANDNNEQTKIKNLETNFISNDEIWKDIPINLNYEASTFGRIRNKKMKNILSPFEYKSGYLGVGLRGMIINRKTYRLHYLIALTHIPNNENKSTINHKDKNRLNNNINNLEWNTNQEQMIHQLTYKPTNKKGHIKGISDLSNINENEIWKSVSILDEFKDFTNYEISNYGRLKYKIKTKIKITSGNTSSDKYKNACLTTSVNKNIKRIAIHRLVALMFIENPHNKPYVNHKDGNRVNNVYTNLEWNTPSENSQHAHDTGLNNTKRIIYQLDINNNIINEYDSLKTAYESLNGKHYKNGTLGTLSASLNLYHNKKVSRKWKGHYWCFKSDYENLKQIHNQYVNNKTIVLQKEIKTNNIIKKWDSIMEASEFYSAKNNSSKKAINANISSCCRGKRKSCQGFIWEYN